MEYPCTKGSERTKRCYIEHSVRFWQWIHQDVLWATLLVFIIFLVLALSSTNYKKIIAEIALK